MEVIIIIVQELVSHLWYGQKMKIVNRRDYDRAVAENVKYDDGKALFIGRNYELRSVVFQKIMTMRVDSYGVNEAGIFIVEVH